MVLQYADCSTRDHLYLLWYVYFLFLYDTPPDATTMGTERILCKAPEIWL
jgi:hypothetical protein